MLEEKHSTAQTSHVRAYGYEAVIGLEIHAQLKTKTKIFCNDPVGYHAGDNEFTSPVSLAMPGTLPVLNAKVVELAVRAGLALNCEIRTDSQFARKNYFYPDLPKGYQISQDEHAICENGYLEFFCDGEKRRINIIRAHLEEDAGKSTHHGMHTLLNFNRAGIPLLEIVSAPEIRSPAEAAAYARAMRQILQYIDVCEGNLEEGTLRCDCNVSIRKVGDPKLGTRVELKNINSFRFIEKALEYEIDRQIDLVERGGRVVQETRLYDADKNRTVLMRVKEDAEDYRYFPDPDLPPIFVAQDLIEDSRKALPVLPMARLTMLMGEHGLSESDAQLVTQDFATAEYFTAVAEGCGNWKAAANWLMTEVMRELNERHQNISDVGLSSQNLAALIRLIDQGKISGKIAKAVFSDLWGTGKNPEQVVNEKGLGQISDANEIRKIVDAVIAANPTQVADFRAGKTKILGFLVGAAMKMSKGQANPDLLNSILQERLKA